MRILKLEPALLSETLVLVPLTPGMGVLIAAILHKLSIEVVPKCVFFSRAHTAVTLNEMTVSSHSLCSPAIPCSLLFSLIHPSHFLSLSLSHLSVLHLWGQVMNGVPALIGWCMMLLGGMKAYITQRTWNGKGEKGEESAGVEILKCFDKRLWKREDGECCRCLHVTMGVGHSFTDASTLAHFLWEIVLQNSSLHPLPLSLPVWRRRADCAVP